MSQELMPGETNAPPRDHVVDILSKDYEAGFKAGMEFEAEHQLLRPTAQAVAVDELSGNGLKLEAGFVYENGVHTPTVLISFPPGDFDGRDKFMRGIQQAALEGR